jgi:glycosyltransferase involved in cell wall biosynthesis
MPTVSVCIPNYNHARYLPEVLRSVLQQSVRPTEVIVLDDGSLDDSVNMIRFFEERDPLVRLVRNERNLGVVATLNRAVNLARGEFVHCLAADDSVLPGFYERSLATLTEHPQAGLCCTRCLQFDEVTGQTRSPFTAWSETPRFFTPAQLALAPHDGHIISQTALLRRDAVLEAGGFRPALRWHCDWLLNWVIAFRYGACYVPDALAVMRLVASSYSTGTRRWEEQRSVLRGVLRTLQSEEFADVWPHVEAGGIFWCLNDRQAVVRTVLAEPALQTAPLLRAVQRMLDRYYGGLIEPERPDYRRLYTADYLRRRVNGLVDGWRASGVRVLIYGAGEHTTNLLKWTNLLRANIVALADADPATHGDVRWGLDVLPPARIADSQPDVIVISSASWQDEIYDQLRPYESRGIGVVRLYDPSQP